MIPTTNIEAYFTHFFLFSFRWKNPGTYIAAYMCRSMCCSGYIINAHCLCIQGTHGAESCERKCWRISVEVRHVHCTNNDIFHHLCISPPLRILWRKIIPKQKRKQFLMYILLLRIENATFALNLCQWVQCTKTCDVFSV